MARYFPTLLHLTALLLMLSMTSCLGSCFGDNSGEPLRLATTTSVQDSGLLSVLLAAFEGKSGYRVDVSAVGSGKALARLAKGEADVAITHAPAAEHEAVATGRAARRTAVMHNAFVIAGPGDMLARVAGAGDYRTVLESIATSGAKFVSRGDRSGTHLREQALWHSAGLEADADFIIVAQAGMGDTLRRASEEEAFTLTDRATFMNLHDDLDLVIVFQGDEELRNVYSVLEPGPEASGADVDGARALADFLRSAEGRALIGSFGVERLGQPLFTPEP